MGYVHPPANASAILEGVASTLPSYMVPQFIVGIEEWPRTSSAKIDRKRLPKPDLESAKSAEGEDHLRPDIQASIQVVIDGLVGKHIDSSAPLMLAGVTSL